jgi:hypothetical protein
MFADFITNATELITAVLGWIPDIGELLLTVPILALSVVFWCIGKCTGIFGSLLGKA